MKAGTFGAFITWAQAKGYIAVYQFGQTKTEEVRNLGVPGVYALAGSLLSDFYSETGMSPEEAGQLLEACYADSFKLREQRMANPNPRPKKNASGNKSRRPERRSHDAETRI